MTQPFIDTDVIIRFLTDVQEMLTSLVHLPQFQVQNRWSVLRALDLYAVTKLDFGDACAGYFRASVRKNTCFTTYDHHVLESVMY